MKMIAFIFIVILSCSAFSHQGNVACEVKSKCIERTTACKEFVNTNGNPYWKFRVDVKAVKVCENHWRTWEYDFSESYNLKSPSEQSCEWKKDEQSTQLPLCNEEE